MLGVAVARSPLWLDLWESAAPGDPAVAILRADALNDQAGEARGAKSAQHRVAEPIRDVRASPAVSWWD